MSTSFFRRTATVLALLLAASGMHAAATQQPARPSRAVIDASGRHLHGNAAHRFLAGGKTKASPTIETPFTRIMAPKIKAEQAKLRAAGKLSPASTSSSRARAGDAGAIGSDGLAVNFPGFFHPSLITTISSVNDSDVSQAVTADVNKDGKPDLITVQSDGTINVLLNTGTGLPVDVTSTNTTLALSYAPSIDFVSAVDLNNDGYPDLELVDGNGYVYILMNIGAGGNGTFAAATQITLPLPSGNAVNFGANGFGGDVLFADITGDGKQDMVVLSGQYPNSTDTDLTVQLFAGVGDGTFPQVTQSETSTVHNYLVDGSFHSMKAVDLNNDGHLDLVFPAVVHTDLLGSVAPVQPNVSVQGNIPTNNFAYTYVLTGNNLGIFSPFPDNITNSSAGSYAVDADESIYNSYAGNLGNSPSPGIVIVGNQAIYSQASNNDATLQPAVASAIYTGDTEDARVGDVNGDGIVDVVAFGDGYLSVYSGVGDGTFNVNATAQLLSGYSSYQAAQPADFDGDGIVDIIGVGDYASAGLYLGLGSGAFKGAPVIAPPGENPYDISAILTGNLTGKGFADVLAYDYNTIPTSLVTAINDGKGNFTYVPVTNLQIEGFQYVETATLDIDNNGTQDLLLATTAGLYEALSNGDGTFQTPVLVPLGGIPACATNYAAVGDLNGDGKQDVVLAFGGCEFGDFTNAGYFTLLNQGDGTFTPSFTAYGNAPYGLSFADFNNDGNLDLLELDSNGLVTVIPGVGDGTFSLQNAVNIFGGSITSVLSGDFNGDGNQDVVAMGSVGSGFGAALLQGKGDLTFPDFTPIAYEFFPYGGVAADFNGDGKLDIALEGYTDDNYEYNGGIGLLVNLGAGNFSTPVLLPTIYSNEGTAQAFGTPIVLGDFNSDGAPDFMAISWYTSGIFYNAGQVGLTLTTSNATVSQGASVTLTATITPSPVGGAQATGTITFYDNGVAIGTSTVSGNAATFTLSTLAIGTNAITAVYSGDASHNGATSAATVNSTVAVNPLGTVSLVVTASALTSTQGSPVTLTATLTTTGGSGQPTGSVTFYDNGVVVGIVPVTSDIVNLTLSSMPAGSNVITASYSGDATYNTATSTATVDSTLTVTPLTATFTMATVSGGTLALTVGQTGVATFTLTSTASFSGPIALTCTGAPKGTLCILSPTSVTLNGVQTATFTAVLDTTAPNNHYNAGNSFPTWLKTTGGITLAGGLLLLWPGRRRRNLWTLVLISMIGLGTMASITGCAHKYEGTPAGTYMITVTSIGGPVTQTATIALTIKE